MDILIGLLQMLAKMAVFAVFSFAGIFLGINLRKKKNLKLEEAAADKPKSEEE